VPARDGTQDEATLASKGEEARIETDLVAVMLGNSRGEVVEPDLATDAEEEMKGVERRSPAVSGAAPLASGSFSSSSTITAYGRARDGRLSAPGSHDTWRWCTADATDSRLSATHIGG